MARPKIPRKSTSVDMTAMCDVAFLLLSFFILTTKFKPSEAVPVSTPTSVASKVAPEKDIVMISLNKDQKVFLSTLASVATLIGLLGTVVGMIRSFSALGESGGGEAAQKLSQGISEALYNTALGIGTSAIAIVMYNVFTTKIDAITYGIDESGFTLTQSFAANYK